jgi:ribosome recycling factor
MQSIEEMDVIKTVSPSECAQAEFLSEEYRHQYLEWRRRVFAEIALRVRNSRRRIELEIRQQELEPQEDESSAESNSRLQGTSTL